MSTVTPPTDGRSVRSGGRLTAVVATAMVLAAFDTAGAGVLVKYPFNNNSDGSNGFAATTLDTGVLSGSVVTAGSGLGQYSVGTDSWSGSTQVLKTGPGILIYDATASDAIANNWYFDITLTPTSAMDIRSIEADWSRGGSSGTRGWFVRSSLDSYASNLFTNETPDGTPTGLQHAGFNVTGFTGLSTAVTFRFYIYTPRTGRYMDFQNIQFNSHALAMTVPGGAGVAMIPLAFSGLRRGRRRD